MPHNVTTNALPFAVSVVETAESKEWKSTMAVARNYLENKEYDKLEALAAEGRSGEDAWPNGDWKVAPVYGGLAYPASNEAEAWLARQKALKDWIQNRPASITARVALAENLTDYAWNARGNGFANTVSDAAEKLFEDRLAQAAVVLSDAKDLKEKCPVYWTTMMTIARGLQVSKVQFDNIFNQAVQAWPDYPRIYEQRATFLLPRWYGAEGEWEADLAKSADRLGGTKGDILYAQVVSWMHGYSEQHNIFESSPGLSWERIDRGWDAIEKQFPDSLEALNAHAHLAGLAGDREKARLCLMKTGGKITMNQWSAKGEFIDFANWALAQ
ncbi:MAG: DUF4034 domain-containing protein [Verrucomicrobiae bacterium]|nr:DUF4034 domain-containing protein [Verrucomicrobiae bacterium]